MADCMTFPDTVEEFMEQYKVVDTKQVYTNGTEFVPIYRMRQWFQHEPERKKGRWIPVRTGTYDSRQKIEWRCSECGAGMYRFYQKFCHECGAKMEGMEKSDD